MHFMARCFQNASQEGDCGSLAVGAGYVNDWRETVLW